MSRPPIHRRTPSPRGLAEADRYFAPRFADLVRLAETLARERHGIEIPEKGRSLARTVAEIPAVFAHILGEHQSLYAREAFVGTARLPDSLARHAAKLAYAPDPGVAATGLAAFTLKPGLAGELPAAFALQSAPKGEIKAQTYETLAPVMLDAAWNALRPADAEIATPMQIIDGRLEIPINRRHSLARGEVVLVEGQGKAGVFRVEDPLEGATQPRLALTRLDASGSELWPAVATGYRILARPQASSRMFGWNANAAVYPPSALATPKDYGPPPASVGAIAYGYELPPDRATDSAPALGTELFLADAIEALEPGARAVLLSGAGASALAVTTATDRTILFRRGEQMLLPEAPDSKGSDGLLFTLLPFIIDTGAGKVTSVAPAASLQIIESSLSARVTALRLANPVSGAARSWTTFPLDATLLTGWDTEFAVAPRIPNPDPFELTVVLAADLVAMRPGRPLILRRTDTGEVLAATIAALLAPAGAGDPWQAVLSLGGAALPSGWTKGNTEILANVAKVSHGESKSEILGGSDGVTPHQAFPLKDSPVTRLPGALGAEIALELRVDGVVWDLAEDFHGHGPDARSYRTETDAEGNVSLHFGGEGRGAIPPAGRRNLTASYRVGLGAIGDIEPGRLGRIKRASPLLDAVTNPLPVRGGADPAGPEDIARQATRSVRLFDRAVSVADHADLALLFPGVARAAARWLSRGAIELVAADAAGQAIADKAALRAFLDVRRDTGIPLEVLDPQPVPVAFALRIERDAAFLADAVRLAIEDALIGAGPPPGLFTFGARELSAPQSLSGVYARLLDLPGVTGAEATRFAIKPATGVADILHATDRQWLSLAPADLDISVIEPGQLVPDVVDATP